MGNSVSFQRYTAEGVMLRGHAHSEVVGRRLSYRCALWTSFVSQSWLNLTTLLVLKARGRMHTKSSLELPPQRTGESLGCLAEMICHGDGQT